MVIFSGISSQTSVFIFTFPTIDLLHETSAFSYTFEAPLLRDFNLSLSCYATLKYCRDEYLLRTTQKLNTSTLTQKKVSPPILPSFYFMKL